MIVTLALWLCCKGTKSICWSLQLFAQKLHSQTWGRVSVQYCIHLKCTNTHSRLQDLVVVWADSHTLGNVSASDEGGTSRVFRHRHTNITTNRKNLPPHFCLKLVCTCNIWPCVTSTSVKLDTSRRPLGRNNYNKKREKKKANCFLERLSCPLISRILCSQLSEECVVWGQREQEQVGNINWKAACSFNRVFFFICFCFSSAHHVQRELFTSGPAASVSVTASFHTAVFFLFLLFYFLLVCLFVLCFFFCFNWAAPSPGPGRHPAGRVHKRNLYEVE